MTQLFDPDAVFGEGYLTFNRRSIDDERSDDDAAVAIAHGPLVPPARVLDAGCGHGRLAVRLAAHGLSVVGVDRSEAFLDLAARAASARGVAVELRRGDLRELPVEDGSVDAVACWFTTFGYFDDEGNAAVLAEFRRVLCPGGVVLIETLHHDGVVRSFTEEPEAIVVEDGEDLQVDRNRFDVARGRLCCRRVSVWRGERREVEFAVRLPTVPEWHGMLEDAGFGDVSVLARDGRPVALGDWRHVVRGVAA